MMPWLALETRLKGWVARVLRLDVLTETSATGFSDRVAGHVVSPGEPEIPTQVQRGGHYPFFGRPPVGSEVVLGAAAGSSNSLITLASRTPQVKPSLEDGEGLIKTIHDVWLLLAKDGRLRMSSPSATTIDGGTGVQINAAHPHKVVINGGTHAVAREGDGVWAGDMKIKATTASMVDTLTVHFVTKDPRDTNYPNPPQKMLELHLPAGSVVFPDPSISQEITIHLTGVIWYGGDRFDA